MFVPAQAVVLIHVHTAEESRNEEKKEKKRLP
jgi:hypothetical protein